MSVFNVLPSGVNTIFPTFWKHPDALYKKGLFVYIYVLFKGSFEHSISVASAVGSENEGRDRTRTEAAVVLFEAGMQPPHLPARIARVWAILKLLISRTWKQRRILLFWLRSSVMNSETLSIISVRNQGTVVGIYSSFFIVVMKSVICLGQRTLCF